LGTGSTAELLVRAVAERVRTGLRVTGVPTSERTQALAASLGIPLADLDAVDTLDLSIDGADEILLPALDLIKGHGGALLREKLVAQVSQRRIIIADATKVVSSLGAQTRVPVEVVRFGWRHTAQRLAALGVAPALRQHSGGAFVTDGGNYILDCACPSLGDPAAVARALKLVTGVVDSGLFIGMTERVIIGGPDGVRAYDRPL
ncbi:MAG TPA: ribose 5-phosphate isomerase A, partial [Ktedonobacterales bacterium]